MGGFPTFSLNLIMLNLNKKESEQRLWQLESRRRMKTGDDLLGCTIILNRRMVGWAGGEAASHCVSEIDERKWEEGICSWFFVIQGNFVLLRLSSPLPKTAKNGTGTYLRGSLRQVIPSAKLALS
jgi:hypothetical protein